MFGDDAEFGGSLGAGGADEVLVEDFEHAAAGEAGEVSGVNQTKGEGRKDAVRGVIPAGGVEPAQVDGEEQDEEGAHDEGGHADADHGEGGGGVVPKGVFFDGSEDTERDAEEEGDEEGEAAQLEGDGEGGGDDLVDGAIGVTVGRAEVDAEGGVEVEAMAETPGGETSGGEVEEVGAVLVEEGAVEAVVGLDVAHDFG